jgi:hypothetical protein
MSLFFMLGYIEKKLCFRQGILGFWSFLLEKAIYLSIFTKQPNIFLDLSRLKFIWSLAIFIGKVAINS